jgi:hypothetical protein
MPAPDVTVRVSRHASAPLTASTCDVVTIERGTGGVAGRGRDVLLSGDQQLVVDAVGTALAGFGFALTRVPFATPERCEASPATRVGVLLCDPELPPTLLIASRIIARIQLPWVVVASTSRGPGWDALSTSGARTVVGHGVSVVQLTRIIDGLLTGAAVPDSRPGC